MAYARRVMYGSKKSQIVHGLGVYNAGKCITTTLAFYFVMVPDRHGDCRKPSALHVARACPPTK
jgi:hypothetical protein